MSSTTSSSAEYRFKLFSYFAMTILSIAIMVGLFIILQHMEEEEKTDQTIANQDTLIENQELLKKILQDQKDALVVAKEHEEREEKILGNNTSTNIGVSKSNSERLDLLLNHFNITYNK